MAASRASKARNEHQQFTLPLARPFQSWTRSILCPNGSRVCPPPPPEFSRRVLALRQANKSRNSIWFVSVSSSCASVAARDKQTNGLLALAHSSALFRPLCCCCCLTQRESINLPPDSCFLSPLPSLNSTSSIKLTCDDCKQLVPPQMCCCQIARPLNFCMSQGSRAPALRSGPVVALHSATVCHVGQPPRHDMTQHNTRNERLGAVGVLVVWFLVAHDEHKHQKY